jgi:hypothetical protein
MGTRVWDLQALLLSVTTKVYVLIKVVLGLAVVFTVYVDPGCTPVVVKYHWYPILGLVLEPTSCTEGVAQVMVRLGMAT